MADDKTDPLDLDQGELDDIEIEFVDEGTGFEASSAQSATAKPHTSKKEEEPVALGPSVEEELERLESELEELRDIHLRKLAEFDNFRKRTERERVEIKQFASVELVRELLPVLDNFERALAHGSETDAGAFHEGVEMIAKQLWETLERQGVEVLNPVGEKFSPEFHEAVHRVEDPSLEPGVIASVMAKGYLCNGRLVRPAMVGVVADAVEERRDSSDEGAADGDSDE